VTTPLVFSNVYLGNKSAAIITTSEPRLNVSSIITFRQVPFSSVRIVHDPEDDGVLTPCPDNICTQLSFAGTTFIFNVSHFTNYSVQDAALATSFACGIMTSSVTLTQNVNASSDCFTFNVSNIALDCAGYQINYSQGSKGHAVVANGTSNISVRNCNIVNEGQTGAHGINFSGVNNSFIANNTLTVNGSTAVGIYVRGGTNVTIANNSVTTTGLGSSKYGIELTSGVVNATIRNNVVSTSGTSSGHYGIYLVSGISGGLIDNNTVSASGSTSIGIAVESSSANISIINNTVSSGSSFGIYLSTGVSQNRVASNGVTASSSRGIHVGDTANNNSVINNTITGNTGISLLTTVRGTLVADNRVLISGGGNPVGILLQSSVNGSTIANNSVRATSGATTVTGIKVMSASMNNIVIGNTVSLNGTSDNYGIRIQEFGSTRVEDTTVANNIVTTAGTGHQNFGIWLANNASHTLILNNTVTTNGTNFNDGIRLQTDGSAGAYTFNNTVANNTVLARGNGTNTNGIYVLLRVDKTLVSGNNVRVQAGNKSHAFEALTFSTAGGVGNITLKDNNFTTAGNSSYAIFIENVNGTVFNNTILHDPSEWISLNDSSTIFQNTTFFTPNTTVVFQGRLNASGKFNVTRSRFAPIPNATYLNSSDLTFMDASARIAFNSIDFSNPQATYDPEDDGTFTVCPASICTEISYVGRTFVFDVTHFTNYSVQEQENSTCGEITSDLTLVSSVNSTGTCFTINASNVVLDCAGYKINYSQGDVSGGNPSPHYGVQSNGTRNVVVKNCNVTDATSSGGSIAGIYFTNVTNGMMD
ncbi:MAG: right-handed parallel beta-helix repeat-containing protein, partial [Nanoarchaeota archaeon]